MVQINESQLKRALSYFCYGFLFMIVSFFFVFQIMDYFRIRSALQVFTLQQGRELCLRVQTLEKDQLIIKPCDYPETPPRPSP